MVVVWYAGLVRGVVAFALALAMGNFKANAMELSCPLAFHVYRSSFSVSIYALLLHLTVCA